MTTWTRLKNGDWGLRGSPQVIKPGREVVVMKKNGERQMVTVGKVVWSDAKTANATVAGQQSQKQEYNGYRRSGGCRGCGGPIRHAPHHRAMDGYCGYCAFDAFDV